MDEVSGQFPNLGNVDGQGGTDAALPVALYYAVYLSGARGGRGTGADDGGDNPPPRRRAFSSAFGPAFE